MLPLPDRNRHSGSALTTSSLHASQILADASAFSRCASLPRSIFVDRNPYSSLETVQRLSQSPIPAPSDLRTLPSSMDSLSSLSRAYRAGDRMFVGRTGSESQTHIRRDITGGKDSWWFEEQAVPISPNSEPTLLKALILAKVIHHYDPNYTDLKH